MTEQCQTLEADIEAFRQERDKAREVRPLPNLGLTLSMMPGSIFINCEWVPLLAVLCLGDSL